MTWTAIDFVMSATAALTLLMVSPGHAREVDKPSFAGTAVPLCQPRPFPKPEGTASGMARIPIESIRQPDAVHQATDPVQSMTRAEQLARRATTRDELAHVIELCAQADPDPFQGGQTANSVGHAYAGRLAAWAANRRGELAMGAGDETAGLADFNQAIEFDSSCWQAIHNRGVCHALRGDRAAALADWNRVIELNPDCATAYRNRGELRLELGLAKSAIADYSQAIAKEPGQSELYHLRGFAEHRLGHHDAAVRDYNRALQIEPHNVAALTGRGNVHAELGHYYQAIEDYRAALQIHEGHAPAYRAAAWLMATCPNPHYRRPDKALIAARRAVVLAQHVDPVDFDTLAAAQASAGLFLAAVESQERAIELAGAQPVVKEFRERLAHYRAGKPFLYEPSERIRR